MDDFSVKGADQFLALSKALKNAGRKEMRKELNKAVRNAAKPVITDVKAAASSSLPKRGGLNVVMSKARSRIVTKTGRDPGVAVSFPGKQRGYIDGVIKHPVFAGKSREQVKYSRRKDGTGNKYRGKDGAEAKWVTQRVDGDWFDGTIEKAGPRVRPEIEKAIQRIADQIVREAGY